MRAADVGDHIDMESERIIGVGQAVIGNPAEGAGFERGVPLWQVVDAIILDLAGPVQANADNRPKVEF